MAPEFQRIARLFAPLTLGAPEALGLKDDAALLSTRPGFELVVTQDAIVEGVHFLAGDPPELIGRKLLRVNLSDLAAKGAEPYGALLTVGWPAGWGEGARSAFAEGLGADVRAFCCPLLGGDTVQTPGPMFASLTALGWVPAGEMVKRSGAQPGDVLLVSGAIGDGVLGLEAARGGFAEVGGERRAYLVDRYQLPEPRLALAPALRAHASASVDVSDGLLADAGHIGEASRCGLAIELERLPLSEAARLWLAGQPDRLAACLRLATGGDDYEIVCTARPHHAEALADAAGVAGVPLTVIGGVEAAPGTRVTQAGSLVRASSLGWSHT